MSCVRDARGECCLASFRIGTTSIKPFDGGALRANSSKCTTGFVLNGESGYSRDERLVQLDPAANGGPRKQVATCGDNNYNLQVKSSVVTCDDIIDLLELPNVRP